ncbi:MAG: NAD(+)/NADH kinase [Ignisphaera sp.]
MRIGVVAKRGNKNLYRIVQEILSYGHSVLGLDMLLDEDLSKEIGWSKLFRLYADKVDFLVVVGGDGTLFRVIHRLKHKEIPIIGVRAGRRGFLLDVEPREALNRLRDLLEGRYEIHEYMMLKVIPGEGEDYYALNDIVVASVRDTRSNVISLEVYVDKELLYRFDGDGVIVSTPVGSTAYTFSAGGPVVDVDLEAIVITPLAPLQPNARPVVLSPQKVIEVVNISETEDALCIVDGESKLKLSQANKVVIKKAEQGVKFVRFKRFTTFKRIQTCEF